MLMMGGRRPSKATGRFFATQTQTPTYTDNTIGALSRDLCSRMTEAHLNPG